MRVTGIQAGNPLGKPDNQPKIDQSKSIPSFKDTLSTLLNDVNDAQKVSSEGHLKLLSGEVTDIHQVMNNSEEANLSFNMLMELRNKALEGYNEILRLRL